MGNPDEAAKRMTNGELMANAAGWIDAEGCILAPMKREVCGNTRLQINLTEIRPLERLRGLFGGFLNFYENSHRGYHAFVLSRKQTVSAFPKLMPFLIIKRKQAELSLELSKSVEEWTRIRRIGVAHPVEMDRHRLALSLRISELKKVPCDIDSIDTMRLWKKREILGYMAGLLEGEGNFRIIAERRDSGITYRPAVRVQMTDKSPLLALQKMFRGTITLRSRKNLGHKDVYFYIARGNDAAEICRKIMPYLLIKRTQAQLLILLQNHVDLWNRRCGWRGLPAEVTAKRHSWFLACKQANSAARAETKPEQPLGVSDSPFCAEPQGAESPEMSDRLCQ